MKPYIFIPLIFLALLALAQQNSIGIFEKHVDVGHPKKAGNARYDNAEKIYYLKGAGYNIWFNRDEFHYLYKKLKGDFRLTANFKLIGDTGNAHRKVGWMIRESTDEGAVHISAVAHGDGLTVLQWRGEKGVNMRDPQDELFFPQKNFEIIQLERINKTITMRVGNPGEPLQEVGSHQMPVMPDKVLAGLFICSHDSNSVVEAKVWNVQIGKPTPK